MVATTWYGCPHLGSNSEIIFSREHIFLPGMWAVSGLAWLSPVCAADLSAMLGTWVSYLQVP